MNRLTEAFGTPEIHQDHPAVIAPPPAILLAFLVAGFALDRMFAAPLLYEPVQYLGGAGLMIAGGALFAAAVRRFALAGTNVETRRPTVAIVRTGPYAHTRNPIYVAMLLCHAAVGVLANAPAVVALTPLLFAVLHFGVVLREEDYLECKFGDAYLDYKASVSRWY